MSALTRNTSRTVLGFTLIEVLIGVLILALGLLGLGAIIPLIVRQQRQASDMSLGAECARVAESILTTRPDMDPASKGRVGWDAWLNRGNWSGPVTGSPGANAYLWEHWSTSVTPNEMDSQTGDFTISDSSVSPAFFAAFPVTERLWPNETVQGADMVPLGMDPYRPQFVWDFIARRLPTPAGTALDPEVRKLQVAVFVRRIDLNIRIPRGPIPSTRPPQSFSLLDVLRQASYLPGGSQYYAVPVCAYGPNAGAQKYRPTNTGVIPGGVPNYSEPIGLTGTSFVAATFDPAERDIIEFTNLSVTDNIWVLISQPGQKLLDNLGNVYTVVGPPEDAAPGAMELEVDPPVPAWVPDPTTTVANGPAQFRQIVFTPQIPAAIHVFTITRTGK
jgi:Tfp pilus assembly protein PilV